MTEEEAHILQLAALQARAIDSGQRCGTITGDQLAQAFADTSERVLQPELVEALHVELLADGVNSLRKAESDLIADGVSPESAETFRMAAVVAMLARLRLAGITTAVSGTAH